MCLFKKKTKIEINSKYKLGERVYFKYKGDVTCAYVYSIKESEGKLSILFKSEESVRQLLKISKKILFS